MARNKAKSNNATKESCKDNFREKDTNEVSNSKPTQRRGGKANNGGRRNKDREECKSGKKALRDLHSNNIEWWNKSVIYPDAVSVQKSFFPGYIYDQTSYLPDSYGKGKTLSGFAPKPKSAMPNIMAIEYVPTLGYSADASSPVNRSFNSIYNEIVAKTNSANLGFQQADLALMTLAAVSIVNGIAEVTRALAIRRLWVNQNADLPYGLYAALKLNVGPETKDMDWETWRTRLNTLIDNFNALGIPNFTSLFERAFQLGWNIYADEDDVVSQVYVFRSHGYYLYQDTEMKVKYVDTLADNPDIPMMLSNLDKQIESLRNTTDMAYVFGGVRRAFPTTDLVRLDYAPIDDVVVPYHDRNMMYQINNMTLVTGAISGLDVTQDPVANMLVCKPKVTYATSNDYATELSSDVLLNSYDGNVDDEFVMESTRLTVTAKRSSVANEAELVGFGTELVTNIAIVVKEEDSSGKVKYNRYANTKGQVYEVDNTNNLPVVPLISRFRNAPRLYLINTAATTNTKPYIIGMVGDLYRCFPVSNQQLEQLHLAALQSAYQILV